MTKNISVQLGDRSYPIRIERGSLPRLGSMLAPMKIGTDAVIITNAGIVRRHGAGLIQGLKNKGFSVKVITVADGEESKSWAVAGHVLARVAAYDTVKKVFIIALGGGVVGDLAGYIAAVYKRGVPFVQVPTTLLAQIDSAIGGKVAVDLPVGKNLMGAFYQPRLVVSDIATLATLPARQIRNGLAEAVKYGVISDEKLFRYIAAHGRELLAADPTALATVVRWCSEIKAAIVSRDEKETKGVRTILNFGHTVGHAIEAAGGFATYQHGEAITLGMRVAAEISLKLKMVSPAAVDELNTLLTALGLPSRIGRVPVAAIMRVMQHDKKFISGKNRFVLMRAIGKVSVVEGIDRDVIVAAIKKYM